MFRLPMCCVLGLTIVAACGDDDAPPDAGDAGADVDTSVDGAPPDVAPSAPATAALPVLTPCPAGWLEVEADVGEATYCAPYDAAGLIDCPPTEAHYPGAAGCEPVTSPCPADGWPSDVPETDVVYVRADATEGGDGTRGAPFRTIAEALAGIAVGGAIAVAPGSYGPSVIDRDVALRGACAEVVFSTPGMSPALMVDGATSTIDNVRISGGGVGDGLKAENSTLTASRIVVDNLRGVGVDFTNSVVTATRMRLSDIDDTAMYVLAGSRLTASELAFTGTMTAALRTGAADATLRDVVFRISGTEPEVFTGARGGETTFERMAAVGDGTLLLFDGVGLTLRDSSIVGQASSDSAESSAIVAFGGSSILLERTSIRRVWSVAVAAAELGSELVATDVVIRADAEGAVDHAIEVGEGAHAALTRVFVAGVDGIGVLATDEGTTVSAEDLVVRETQSNSGGLLGRALQIQRGAHLSGQRVHCAANHEVAVVAGALAATVDLSDVIIEGTRERGCTAPGCAGAGIGLGAYLGGHISLNRFRIMGSALAGAQLAMDGEIDLSDGVISGNPVGVNVQSPDFDLARLTSGVLFQDNGINLDADELPLPAATTR